MDQSQQRLASALSSTTHYIAPAQHAPMAFSIREACKVAGVGRSAIYTALQTGALVARKNGAKNLILRADLENWLFSLPTERPAALSGAARRLRHRATAAAEAAE